MSTLKKRAAVDAGDEEEAPPPNARRRVVGESEDDDDDSVFEVMDALPPKTNVAMVEKLLNHSSAEKTIDYILDLLNQDEEEIRDDILGEFKGTDICKNLVHALNTAKSYNIKSKACELIGVFADTAHDDDIFEKKFNAADAPDAIVHAMKQFPKKGKLQQRGCHALTYLLCEDVKKAVGAGCIGVVVAAIKNHGAAPRLLENAIECLDFILPTSSAELLVAVDPVITAMDNNIEDEDVQEEALYFLRHLSSSNEQAKAEITKKGGSVAAAAAERKYEGKNDCVHSMARRALVC